MKPEWIAAERDRVILAAVRSWRRAGLIDEAALELAGSRHAGAPAVPGTVWRILIFFFVGMAVWGFLGTVFMLFGIERQGEKTIAWTFILYGVLLAWLTERLAGERGPGVTGADAASSLSSLVCFGVGAGILLHEAGLEGRDLERAIPGLMTILLLAAALRWGYLLYAAGSAAALFLLLGTFPPAGCSGRRPELYWPGPLGSSGRGPGPPPTATACGP